MATPIDVLVLLDVPINAVEVLFGVPNHFGQNTERALAEIVDVLEHGMVER